MDLHFLNVVFITVLVLNDIVLSKLKTERKKWIHLIQGFILQVLSYWFLKTGKLGQREGTRKCTQEKVLREDKFKSSVHHVNVLLLVLSASAPQGKHPSIPSQAKL